MMRRIAWILVAAAFIAAPCPAQIQSAGSATAAGAVGSVQVAGSGNALVGATPSQDCTTNVSGSNLVFTCTKTNNVNFATSATTDTTNASNITTGTLPVAQIPLATSSTVGGVKPDNTTITISSGIITATGALPTISNNAVLGNVSGSSASPVGIAVPNCTGGSSALTFVGSSGFGCQTGLAAGAGLGANTFTDTQTITQATALHSILASTGFSSTGSDTTPLINFAGTLNTTGAIDVLKFALTCTSCGSANLINLYGGASGTTSEFKVSSGGTVTAGLGFTAPSTGTLIFNARGQLTSSAAGNLQCGAADAAAPVACTFSAQSVVAGTSNTAGQNMVIQGSRGTGTGAGGQILLKTAPAGSTGTTQNAAVTALAIDQTQYVIPGAGTPTCGTGCSSIAAGATNQRMLVTTGTAVTSIAVNFSTTLTTAPICTATEIAGTPLAIGFNAAPSTSGFTLTAASALTATVIAVTCL